MNTNLRRVLIVDDDEDNARALSERLKRKNFDSICAFNSNNILSVVESEKIEIVLLDIVMPDKNGITVLSELRQKFSKTALPVIMVTASEDNVDNIEAFNQGANDYMTKPVQLDLAISRIYAHLGLVDLSRESARKQQLETINNMISTYNHEINNPLMIAINNLQFVLQKASPQQIDEIKKVQESLDRIMFIVKKIKDLGQDSRLSTETYIESSKIFKLK